MAEENLNPEDTDYLFAFLLSLDFFLYKFSFKNYVAHLFLVNYIVF